MQKWEYCELFQREGTGARSGPGGGVLELRIFGPTGYVMDQKRGSDVDEAQVGQVIAWLGQNGWELVSVNTFSQFGYVFAGVRWIFKRPLADTP